MRQNKALKHLTAHTAVVGRPRGCRMRLCLAAVLVSTNAHKLGMSRRTALGAGASAAFAAPAHAASDFVNFEDGTIGLRFRYPKGWRCRGTGALMGLVAGNRVTTCTDESAKDGAVIGIEARMVPANDQLYVDIEKALTEKDVKEMVVPPGTAAEVAVATKGERKAYVLTSEQASQKVVDVFTVHAGEAGQYWAVTVSAAAPAARWPAGLDGVLDSVAFFRSNTDTPFKPG